MLKNLIFLLSLLSLQSFAARVVQVDELRANTAAAALLATSTQLGYLGGVTSDIQTQLSNAASKSLSNLSGVSVNASLIPAVNNSISLGSSSKKWSQVFAPIYSGGEIRSTAGDALVFQFDAFGNRILLDSSETIAIDLETRRLQNSSGINMLDWAGSGVTTAVNIQVPSLNGISSTVLAYLSGVTSAIQTQLNGKLNKAGDTMSGNLEVGVNNGSTKLAVNQDPTNFNGIAGFKWTNSTSNGGATLTLSHNASGTSTNQQSGLSSSLSINSGSNTSTSVNAGVIGIGFKGSSATVTNLAGGYFEMQVGGGTVTNGYGGYFKNPGSGATNPWGIFTDGRLEVRGQPLLLSNSSGTAISIQAPASPTAHTLTLPGTQGASGAVLRNDGSGVLTWAEASTITYTATTPGDWNGAAPTTIGAALDRLAACAKSGTCVGTGP